MIKFFLHNKIGEVKSYSDGEIFFDNPDLILEGIDINSETAEKIKDQKFMVNNNEIIFI